MPGNLDAGGGPPQLNLLFPEPKINTVVFKTRGDFERLFEGFRELKAISYVVSPTTLLEFREQFGFERIEIVVGENLAVEYKRSLEGHIDRVEELAQLVESDSVTLWLPARTIHSKFYILSYGGRHRVIQTSANLTETARSGSRQVNYAWYVDIPDGHPFLEAVNRDYEAHRRSCKKFMGDLLELLQARRDFSRTDLIQAWLSGESTAVPDRGMELVLDEVSERMLDPVDSSRELVFTVTLPKLPSSRRMMGKVLQSMEAQITGDRAQLNMNSVLRYYEREIGVPLMRVSPERSMVQVGIGGKIHPRAAGLPDRATVDDGLARVERYIATVERGQSSDHQYAKSALFEAFLYLYASPFSYLYMEALRERFGILDRRGPRVLFLYGPTQNGKTTFLKFALQEITGQRIDPLESRQFTKSRVQGVASLRSAFPLAFDDISPTPAQKFEAIIKPYWETWWTPGSVFPQLILASNGRSLGEAAKSRVKRIDFDVQYAPTDEDREQLNRIFSAPTNVFCWFAGLYISALSSADVSRDDELAAARITYARLYQHAGRELPDYFPVESLERRYNPDKRDWVDLVERLQKAKLRRDGDRMQVVFSDDILPREIREYETQLPQTVKHRRRGRILVIENPADFQDWLGIEQPRRGLFRLLKR